MVYSKAFYRRIAMATSLTFAIGLGAVAPTYAAPGNSAAPAPSALFDDDDGGVYRPVPRPVTLVEGSCEAPGGRVASLKQLRSPEGDDSGKGKRSEYGFTPNLPVSLDQLLSGDYAILVHESEGVMDNIIACANVGGVVDDTGSVVVALEPWGTSNVSGVAYISVNPANRATTNISIFIVGSSIGDDYGTRDFNRDDDDDDRDDNNYGAWNRGDDDSDDYRDDDKDGWDDDGYIDDDGWDDDDDGWDDDDDGPGGDDDGPGGDDDGPGGDDDGPGGDDDGPGGDDDGPGGDDDGPGGDDDGPGGDDDGPGGDDDGPGGDDDGPGGDDDGPAAMTTE